MGRPKKYLTEEERKTAKREAIKRYQERHPEKVRKYQEERKEYFKQYYQDNKNEKLEYQKEYYQDNKEYIKEHNKQYYQDNKEYFKEHNKQYREDNKEYFKEYQKQYLNTPMGRACRLINAYKSADKEHNRGECTLTSEWIIENIFSKPCHYCGKEGWDVIGCDRIDNSKPHTPDNVVPCCKKCNDKRGRRDYEEFILDILSI